MPAGRHSPVPHAHPVTRWVGWAGLLAGVFLSLAGPVDYGEDLDRHLVVTRSVLDGDYGRVLEGHQASGGPDADRRTLSGFYYAFLAPAMALSGRPEWLHTYVDGAILLGAIPLWFLARTFGSSVLALVTVSLFVASSGRIAYSSTALHAFLSLAFCPLLHLMLVRSAVTPRRVMNVIGFVGTLAIVVSLHLSYLPMLLAAQGTWLVYRLRPKLTSATGVVRRRVVGLAVGLGIAGSWILMHQIGGRAAALSVAKNMFVALTEIVGFYGGAAAGPGSDAAPLLLVASVLPLALAALALVLVLSNRVTGVRHRALLVGWITTVVALQLAGAAFGAEEWRFGLTHILRYRYLLPMVPPLLLMLAIGLIHGAEWTAPRIGVRSDAILAVTLGTIILAQLLTYQASTEDRTWRLAGSAVHPEAEAVLSTLVDGWGIGPNELRTSVFVDPGRDKSPEPRWDYFLDAFFSTHAVPGPTPEFDLKVIYLTVPGGPTERELTTLFPASQRFEAAGFNGFLVDRSARRLPGLEPYLLNYGVRRGERRNRGVDAVQLTVDRLDATEGPRILVAANVEAPPELSGNMLFEVVVEEDGPDVLVGARLFGRHVYGRGSAPRLIGPHVLVIGTSGDTVRVDIDYASYVGSDGYKAFRQNGDHDQLIRSGALRLLAASRRIEGWRGTDVADVVLGVDGFSLPRLYEGVRSARWSVRPGPPNFRSEGG